MLTPDRYINAQYLTSHIPYGNSNSADCGCGWIAVYNVLRHLEERPPVAEEIARGMQRGVILGGRLGTWPFAISGFLKKRGFDVKWTLRKRVQARLARESQAAVFLYIGPFRGFGRFKAHYVMLHSMDERNARIFNYGLDPCIQPLSGWLEGFHHDMLTLMIGVKRKQAV